MRSTLLVILAPLLSGTAAAQNGEVELENLKVSLWPEYDQDCRGRKKPAGAKTAKKKAPLKRRVFALTAGPQCRSTPDFVHNLISHLTF